MPLKKVDGYSELLEDFLSDVVLFGAGIVSEQKLRRWTDTKRVTPKMWKLIHQVFEAVLEDAELHKHGYKLYVGEWQNTFSFVIWDRGEGVGKADEPWWDSIESLEETKPRGRTRSQNRLDAEAASQ